jgi:hypothetical protein
MRADSNARWMTQRIVVHVSGILRMWDVTVCDEHFYMLVSRKLTDWFCRDVHL